MNIDELLKQGKQLLKNVEDEHIKARILLENVLNKSREYIVANSELDVDQNNIDIYFQDYFMLYLEKSKHFFPFF